MKPSRGFHWIWLIAAATSVLPSLARAINTGDFIVADRSGAGLIFVDRVTGAQHTLSHSQLGSQGFGDVTTSASGDVFAILTAGAVYKINAVNGAQTLVSSGGLLTFPETVDLAPDGNLYVSQSSGLVRVNPTSGQQDVVVSGQVQAFTVDGNNVGYIALHDTTVTPAFHIYSVDLSTGDKVRISSTGVRNPLSLAVDGSGDIVVVDGSPSGGPFAVKRVNPSTGTFTTITATGPMLCPWGVTLEANGTIVVADQQNLFGCSPPPPAPSTCPGALYRVDPSTGAQTLVTEKDLFHDITGVDIYRGPNVSTPTVRRSWGQVKSLYR